jgi:hypothetical protein
MDRLIDFAVKLVPVLTAIGGAFWVLFTYIGHLNEVRRADAVQADKELRTRQIESQRPFLEKQLALYFETSQVVGKLAAIPSGEKTWTEARVRFWELYWSELSMVESREVEAAMVQFGKTLEEYETAAARSGSPEAAAGIKAALDRLKDDTYHVAHAIRASIESSWSLPEKR